MDSDEDSDEIYDEIDRYHQSLDMTDDVDDIVRRRDKQEEILNVEGSSSSDDDDDDDGDNRESSDFMDSDSDNKDSNNVEKLLPSADKWGSGRKNFYNTSYVDEDWGGMNDAEAELAELEEEDAIARQRKLDASLGQVALHFQDDIDDEEIVSEQTEQPVDFDNMSSDEQFQYFLKINPDFESIYEEYQKMRTYFIDDVLPLLEVARVLKHVYPDLVLEKQLLLAVNVFSRYLTNLLFAIRLKIVGDSKSEPPKYIDHPVLQAISVLQKELSVVMQFLTRNKKLLKKIRRKIESGSVRRILSALPTIEAIKKSKILKKVQEDKSALQEEEVDESQDVGDTFEKEITKRLITSQIEKNKGLQNKRKKGTQHSRVKKRKQFRKALIKKRSQKPEIRKELTPYGGEARGIRASTIKSIKLKA